MIKTSYKFASQKALDLPHLNSGNVEINIEDKAIDVINERYAEQSQALGYNIKSSN